MEAPHTLSFIEFISRSSPESADILERLGKQLEEVALIVAELPENHAREVVFDKLREVMYWATGSQTGY